MIPTPIINIIINDCPHCARFPGKGLNGRGAPCRHCKGTGGCRLSAPGNLRTGAAGFGRADRIKAERKAMAERLKDLAVPPLPVTVSLVRVAPSRLDDGDNLTGSFKAIRDEVADWLRLKSDRDERVRWRHFQAKPATPRTYRAEVAIYAGHHDCGTCRQAITPGQLDNAVEAALRAGQGLVSSPPPEAIDGVLLADPQGIYRAALEAALQARAKAVEAARDEHVEAKRLRERLSVVLAADGLPWIWGDTDQHTIESMSEGMHVQMTAGQLRQLLSRAEQRGKVMREEVQRCHAVLTASETLLAEGKPEDAKRMLGEAMRCQVAVGASHAG